MTESTAHPQPHDLDEAIRMRILERATGINTQLLARLSTAAEDLGVKRYRAALGALDGIERQIHIMRTLLQLMS